MDESVEALAAALQSSAPFEVASPAAGGASPPAAAAAAAPADSRTIALIAPAAAPAAAGTPTSLTRRERRIRQLAAYVGSASVPGAPLSSYPEIADRVLCNMAMTVSEQANAWSCPALDLLLKLPLPFDSANELKHSLMLELVPSTGDLLYRRVWGAIAPAMTSSPQATPIALVTGVSGMGKTKLAYDIGTEHGFVVISRVVEHDNFTPPWGVFRDFALELVRTSEVDEDGLLPLSERVALKATLIVLMAAHLQYAVDVSRAAAVSRHFAAAVNAVKRASVSGLSDASARTRVLREVVLRAQRNGLAYQHVKAQFQTVMQRLLAEPNSAADDGTITLSLEQAHTNLASVTRLAFDAWDGSHTPIVFAHDEVQGLLSVPGLPLNLFRGVYASATDDAAVSKPRRGCFYGLLAAIREVLDRVTCAHLLLGNNLDLSKDVISKHSPAQGVTASFDEAIGLTEDQMRVLLGRYLTPEAMAGATDDALVALRGRPLFISRFWSELLTFASMQSCAAKKPDELVTCALKAAHKAALREADARIEQLWERHSPSSDGQVPCAIVRYLFHSLVMRDGVVRADDDMRHELHDCIKRGVLNERGGADRISLSSEPLTAEALRAVGLRRLADGTDGVMRLLSERMTGPVGGETSDQGETLEQCLSWALVSRFLRKPGPPTAIPLGDLLAPFLAVPADGSMSDARGRMHDGLIPALLNELSVRLDRGIRCDGGEWESRCPLELLEQQPTALLYHTTNGMAGPDIIFVASFPDGRQRLVLLQLKNRSTGSISDALPSVNIGRWYTDRRGRGGATVEQSAHRCMREILSRKPDWVRPVRVLAGTRSYQASVLHLAAWLNRCQLEESPVVCLHVTAASIGAGIVPAQDAEYGLPRDVLTWWPTPVRHYDGADLPELPAQPAEDDVPSVSLKVTLSSTESTSAPSQETLVAVARKVAQDTLGEVTDIVRHKTPLASVTVTFSHLLPALEVVERHLPKSGSTSSITVAFA